MAAEGVSGAGATRPGWYPDPTGRQPLRWYDGKAWTPQTLDGWQRPVVDPLDGTALPPPGHPPPVAPTPAPPPMPAAPPVARTPPVPAGPLPPVPVTVSAGMRSPESPPWRPSAFMVLWRAFALVTAAGGMLLGFFALPWVEVPVPAAGRWEPVRYLDYADWTRTTDMTLNPWQSAYLGGLGLLLATFAVAAATMMTVGFLLTGRAPGDGLLLCLLLGISFASQLGAALAPRDLARAGSAAMVISCCHLLLAFVVFRCSNPSDRQARQARTGQA